MCPETAFSDTPDSNQERFSSLQAELMAMRASKLSTQLSTKSTGPPERLPWLSTPFQDIKKHNNVFIITFTETV
jgi:hypothetical protein